MLDGRCAIVTGASRGIGRAAALRLAANGAVLVLNGTNEQLLESLANEIRRVGSRAVILPGDVADPEVAAATAALADQKFGGADILVNNAGINTRSPTLEMPLTDWTRVIDVNLNGTLHFCRAVLPGMIARGSGCIVNVSSTAAKTPHKHAAPAYGASKAAVNYLTMHLAREMAPHGIRVNAVCPGPVETEMTSDWSADYRSQRTAAVPLGRLGSAREIADIIVFLASEMARFVTGESINANGGTFMN
ncbi:MAG: SDR family oxidoreductase [Hyphomicrobiales bacterium]|nr:SDR family oxidoreductase [Hyphomicrobiales bacterium]